MHVPCAFLFALCVCTLKAAAYPEYQAELPNLPVVNGKTWPGVGHMAREGGGARNTFGEDFAAAGYSWTSDVCQRDSDGDGFSNGQELGDPECKWRKGLAPPTNGQYKTSHPGLKASVPQLTTQRPAAAVPAAGAAAAAAGGQPISPATPAVSSTSTSSSSSSSTDIATRVSASSPAEPNADMAVPQGSERNLNGDVPQKWCEARQAAAADSSSSTSGTGTGQQPVGSNAAWHNISLPVMNVLGTSDWYSCHPFTIPDSIPDNREFTGVRIGLDGASHLHNVLLMECPGNLWFLKDITRNSEMCTSHSGSMFAACNRWWVSTEANNDYHMCTPPGLIYARAGEMRAKNKVLVLQVHWVFGAKLQNQSVALKNASLHLLHEDPPAGPKTDIMETIEGTAIYGPSMLQHVNGLVIPGGQQSFTADYKCGRRCTYVPLGRLVPQPVTIAGYTFHGHHFMTGMRMSINRCAFTRMAGHHDLSWEVTDWLKSVVHPTYDVMGQDIKLYPGDQLSWSCTFNTSGVNRTVYGGYAGYTEEMCIMLLHYYPRNALLRGCMAVSPDQGGHSLCMYEGAAILQMQNAEADKVPVRTMVTPHAVFPLTKGLDPGIGYKANVLIFWFLAIPAFLLSCSFILARCRCLGQLHTSYTNATLAIRRNIAVYIMHILLDTVLLCVWIDPLISEWCGCTESITSGRLAGFVSLFVVAAYAVELVWRLRLNTLLLIHHIVTILVIAVLIGELAAALYQAADAMMLLVVSALVEQPTFVALLLQRVLPAGSIHTIRAWKVAVWFWVGSKTMSVIMAALFMVRDWAYMTDWVAGMYICIWALLYSIQLWSGHVQYKIYRNVAAKASPSQQLPYVAYDEQDKGKDADIAVDVLDVTGVSGNKAAAPRDKRV